MKGSISMYILGISGLYHDSAAALVCNGEIIAAAQEERYSELLEQCRIWNENDESFRERACKAADCAPGET